MGVSGAGSSSSTTTSDAGLRLASRLRLEECVIRPGRSSDMGDPVSRVILANWSRNGLARATGGTASTPEGFQVLEVDAPDRSDLDPEESPAGEQASDVSRRGVQHAGGFDDRDRAGSWNGLTILARRRNNFLPNLLWCGG